MQKRKELTESDRNQIIGAWKCGISGLIISKTLKFPTSITYDVINHYKNTEEIKPPSRSGRPPALTERDKRHLTYIVKEDRKVTLNELNDKFIQATSNKICIRTLQKYLHEEGFYSRAGKRKPFVSEINRKKRLEWAKNKINWNSEWNFIVWSDESRFEVFGGDGRHNVWRLPKEKYDIDCFIPTFKSGRKGVIVWGCFTLYSLGPLI